MEENTGFISSIVDLVLLANQVMGQVIGVEPILIVTVVALVSMIDIAFKIRSKHYHESDKILLGICVLMSVLVSVVAIDEIESWKQITRHAFVLSGMTTLSYKFGKPILKKLLEFKLKKMSES